MSNIYLDNAATTFPKPKEVYEYMINMYQNYGANVGRATTSYDQGINSIVKETRDMLKNLVNAKDGYEAVFTPSATIAFNQILWGLDWSKINNVYISYFEHNAVLRTLEAIKKDYDINIKFLEFEKDNWKYDFQKIEYEFENSSPDLVIINHVSNVFGYISTIEEIYDLSKKYNPIYIIDACQSMALVELDLLRYRFDFVIFAGHKTLYGPFGIAGFIMNKNIDLKPYIYGGTGTESMSMNMPNELPSKYEAGSLNTLAIFGLYKALKWINEIGVKNIRKQEEIITRELVSVLQKYDFIQTYIPTNNHIGIVSFKIKGYPVDIMGECIGKNYKITLRYGLHCAPNAHIVSNTLPEGTIRVSTGYFTTLEDIRKLDDALSDLEYEI
ncbi:aminotransferase class V-fold PLP-dependent enzyme [Alkalithermobacter paradoxus]|uniref:Putative cysteine desulfurase n=1 Tax=Alkalithermobacter paradoxus TaxID=29349 RepID=A0A1V4I7X5_9FIRM|nr:putative cysteine desulfurase [[Clostridium] thermoalcaliphilum]